jgi:hypothetical protein
VCIIVLPDVLAEAQAILMGRLLSHRIECRRSMHSWAGVASNAFAAIFREAELAFEQARSNEARAKPS